MTISFPLLLPARPEPAPAELLDQLAAYVEKRTLMQFSEERRAHFVNTLAARVQSVGAPDMATYIRRLVSSPDSEAEFMALVDALTINETTFFRNVPQLDLFARVALPEMIERRRAAGDANRRLEVWSAACSTGQEVYTLAMLAVEALAAYPGWEAQILGTDISPSVLETARQGIYPKARLDTVPPAMLAHYFDDLGDRIRVRNTLRRFTTFQHHNLKDPFPLRQFDVIFCRNVMIYFSREEQARLAQKFRDRLAPGGFLFIGHSESLHGFGVELQLRIQERGVAYQKV